MQLYIFGKIVLYVNFNVCLFRTVDHLNKNPYKKWNIYFLFRLKFSNKRGLDDNNHSN